MEQRHAEKFFAHMAEIMKSQGIKPDGKFGFLPDGRRVHYSWLMAAAGTVSMGISETIAEALDVFMEVPMAELANEFHFEDPEVGRDRLADRHGLQTWNYFRRMAGDA